jgi:hypothetical protein
MVNPALISWYDEVWHEEVWHDEVWHEEGNFIVSCIKTVAIRL